MPSGSDAGSLVGAGVSSPSMRISDGLALAPGKGFPISFEDISASAVRERVSSAEAAGWKASS